MGGSGTKQASDLPEIVLSSQTTHMATPYDKNLNIYFWQVSILSNSSLVHEGQLRRKRWKFLLRMKLGGRGWRRQIKIFCGEEKYLFTERKGKWRRKKYWQSYFLTWERDYEEKGGKGFTNFFSSSKLVLCSFHYRLQTNHLIWSSRSMLCISSFWWLMYTGWKASAETV